MKKSLIALLLFLAVGLLLWLKQKKYKVSGVGSAPLTGYDIKMVRNKQIKRWTLS